MECMLRRYGLQQGFRPGVTACSRVSARALRPAAGFPPARAHPRARVPTAVRRAGVPAQDHRSKAAAKAKAAAKGFGAKPVAAREPALATCRGFGDKQADSSVSQPPSADTIMQGGAAAPGRSTVANSNSRRLEAVVKFNAYGHEHRDLAACEARQEDDSAYVGLWPEYALLNHRCRGRRDAGTAADATCRRPPATLCAVQ
eukprot:354470-Chlamydomonas_euryale.AAC.55